jgi:hypothetical protein
MKEAGKRVSERIQLPLGLHTLPCANPEDGFQAGLRGAVLVRRDGHVAWKMPWLPTYPDRELTGYSRGCCADRRLRYL